MLALIVAAFGLGMSFVLVSDISFCSHLVRCFNYSENNGSRK